MIGCFNCLITSVQVSDYSQLSNCYVRLQLRRIISENKAANAPITFEEIVTVMINKAVVLPRIYTHFQMTKFNHPNTGS